MGRWFVILSNVLKRNKLLGGIAQLGERLTGSQEVSGSIPLISTKKDLFSKENRSFAFSDFAKVNGTYNGEEKTGLL